MGESQVRWVEFKFKKPGQSTWLKIDIQGKVCLCGENFFMFTSKDGVGSKYLDKRGEARGCGTATAPSNLSFLSREQLTPVAKFTSHKLLT